MKLDAVNTTVPKNSGKKYVKAAAHGALLTSGALGLSSAISWAADSVDMKNVVKNAGGESKYIKSYLLGLAVCSILGAMAGAAGTFIADKINPKKSPKAV